MYAHDTSLFLKNLNSSLNVLKLFDNFLLFSRLKTKRSTFDITGKDAVRGALI